VRVAPRRAGALGVGLAIVLLAGVVPALPAHDLFFKLTTYFLRPGARVRVPILNGTFTKSENAIERSRVADLSLVTPGGRAHPDTAALAASGDTTFLALQLSGPGTYVVGMSIRPSEIALSGMEFTAYLEEEAIREVLAERARIGASDRPARERYSKHVKAVFQVGAERTGGFAIALGYPAEIVPLDNPYALGRRRTLRVQCLVDGRPIAGQAVLAGGRTPSGARIRARELHTDPAGVAAIPLDSRGRWYVKFIRMAPAGGGVDYESRWATLTFQVR
jgi:hypothetical protein